jgi:hypothetical protein
LIAVNGFNRLNLELLEREIKIKEEGYAVMKTNEMGRNKGAMQEGCIQGRNLIAPLRGINSMRAE